MIGDVITLIKFLQDNADNLGTISAIFKADGTRIEGSKEIIVEKNTVGNKTDQWFYHIKEKKNYVFVYMPLIPSVYVDYGTLKDESNPNASFFRFVGNPMSSFQAGGAANVTVDFIVIGYQPSSLLRQREKLGAN